MEEQCVIYSSKIVKASDKFLVESKQARPSACVGLIQVKKQQKDWLDDECIGPLGAGIFCSSTPRSKTITNFEREQQSREKELLAESILNQIIESKKALNQMK